VWSHVDTDAMPERITISEELGPIRARGTVVEASVLGWLAVIVGALVLAGIVATEERLPVLLPIVAVTLVAGTFGWRLSRQRESGFPYFEIGVVYVAVVWLYTVFPLVGFVANGLRQTPANDMRLYAFRPSPIELGSIGWYHVAHLLAFAAAYLLWRGRVPAWNAGFRGPDRATVAAAVFAYLTIGGYFLFLHLYFDLSASTYLETYLVHKRLPLIHAQLFNHLGGVKFILELILLAALFADYRRWRLVIAGWIVVMVSLAFIRLWSRTEMVVQVGAAVMMYHYGVRRLRLGHVTACGVIGLSVFLLLGVLRYQQGMKGWFDASDIDPIFGYASEFENNLANAYDVSRLQALGLIKNLPVALYLCDLLALIPQQLIPVEKVNPAVWYVSTFYPDYAAVGGGLAFGTIAESILGFGWVDTVARGGILGLILAQVYRWHAWSGGRLWPFIGYVWLTVSVYLSFRGTTFILVGLFLYRFVPAWAGVSMLAIMLRAVSRRGEATTHLRP
jgi:hypothetical protein